VAKAAPSAANAPAVRNPAPPAARRAQTHSADTRRARRAADPAQLVFELWQSTAKGDRAAVDGLCDPGSPAAAAVRLYGPGGLLVCLELPRTDQPTGVAGAPYDIWRGRRAFAGTVETRTDRRDFLLTWSDDDPLRVAELMPYGAIFQFGLFGRAGRGTGPKNPPPPKPRLTLDPTAGHLWAAMLPAHGLQQTLRALAALWRLEDLDKYLARYDPRTLAAALDRLVGYWTQAPGATYAEAADRYDVAEHDIRTAGAALYKELKLTRQRPW
jgi:hypothetical protein